MAISSVPLFPAVTTGISARSRVASTDSYLIDLPR
jgi:hypothetical protein